MIDRYGDRYELQCDFCSNFEGDFLEFQEAVDFKKANNWKSENVGGQWLDKCPECRRKTNENKM